MKWVATSSGAEAECNIGPVFISWRLHENHRSACVTLSISDGDGWEEIHAVESLEKGKRLARTKMAEIIGELIDMLAEDTSLQTQDVAADHFDVVNG